MRRHPACPFCAALLLAASALVPLAAAHEVLRTVCATDPAIVCAVETEIPGLTPIDIDPVVTDDGSLRLAGRVARVADHRETGVVGREPGGRVGVLQVSGSGVTRVFVFDLTASN